MRPLHINFSSHLSKGQVREFPKSDEREKKRFRGFALTMVASSMTE